MTSLSKKKSRPGMRAAQSETSIRVHLIADLLSHFLEQDPHLANDLYHLTRKHSAAFNALIEVEQHCYGSSLGWIDIYDMADAGTDTYQPYVTDLLGILDRNNLNQIPEAADSLHEWTRIAYSLGRKPTSGVRVGFIEESGPGIGDMTVRVSLEETWPIDRQPRARVREKLMHALAAQLDAELDRIAAAHDDWVWPDTEHSRCLHIDWTYRRLKGESVQHIADHPRLGQPERGRTAVSTATNAIAKAIGIALP